MTDRDANRSRFPELAEIKDRFGDAARILWAKDANGEIGKRPVLERHLFEVSAETLELLRADAARRDKRRK